MITVLDGPLGTELNARGVVTALPLWSASAIDSAPEVVAGIHADYAAAGAAVHTTNTFRTKRRTAGSQWSRLTGEAVRIARAAVPSSHRIAGSISPLEDCYRPDLSPGERSREEHREMAQRLAEEQCDLLLCETFPIIEEAIVAVQESVRTGVETWVAFTAGPEADLLTPKQMAEGARRAVDEGAAAVLVNCTPANKTLGYVQAIAQEGLGVPLGAYANAGSPDDAIGWQSAPEPGATAYAALAAEWIKAGATLIGGCCGTGPKHVESIVASLK